MHLFGYEELSYYFRKILTIGRAPYGLTQLASSNGFQNSHPGHPGINQYNWLTFRFLEYEGQMTC